MKRWAVRILLERGGLLVIAALLLYGWLACPYIVENDNAEFSTLGAIGGIAHPSGYPFYILWLRAWSWLPGSPAHAAALATAILGAAQIGVVHAACRAWGARPLAATLAAGLFATVPLVVRYNTEAEAFALNNLVVASVLWLAAAGGPARGTWRVLLLGLVAGLGLSNHMTCAVVAPVGLLGVVRGVREVGAARALAATALGLVLGLTPYLYLLGAHDSMLSWRPPGSLGDVADIFLRKQFGGPFGFAGLGGEGSPRDQLALLGSTLLRSWIWIGLAIGLGALGVRVARRAEAGEPRIGWAMLAVSFLVAGPLLACRFDMKLDMWGVYVVERFHLLPVLLLVIPVAVGLDRIGRYISDTAPRVARWPIGVLVALGLIVNAIRVLPYLQRFQSPAMEDEVRNTLGTLPPGAVVIGMDDELDVGFRYLQLACYLRPDVTFLRWASMNLDWYRDRFRAEGLSFTPTSDATMKVDLVRAIFATGRPLFIARTETGQLGDVKLYQHGILFRALPPGSTPPSAEDVLALNRKLFAEFSLDYPRPGPDDQYAAWAHWNYTRAWKRIGDALARAGHRDEASAAYELVTQLAPVGGREP